MFVDIASAGPDATKPPVGGFVRYPDARRGQRARVTPSAIIRSIVAAS